MDPRAVAARRAVSDRPKAAAERPRGYPLPGCADPGAGGDDPAAFRFQPRPSRIGLFADRSRPGVANTAGEKSGELAAPPGAAHDRALFGTRHGAAEPIPRQSVHHGAAHQMGELLDPAELVI